MPESRNSGLEGEALARRVAEICDERKAEDIVLYDVTGLSLLTDYYLICTGTAEPHLRGISNQLQKQLGAEGVKPDRVDGAPDSKWIVLDYGTVLVHVFHRELRKYYELEKLFDEDRLILGSEAD